MSLSKELNVAFQLAKMCLLDRIENIFAFLFVVMSFFVKIGLTVILFLSYYRHTQTLNGWTFDQTIFLIGTYYFIEGIAWMTYTRCHNRLPWLIETGGFDTFLIRPINTRCAFIYYWVDPILSLVQIVTSISMILFEAFRNGLIINFGVYMLVVSMGILIHYSITNIISSINFFHIIHNTSYICSEIYRLGQFPISIYHGIVGFVLSFIVPLAFIYSVPALFLFGKGSFLLLACAVGITAFLLFLSSAIWNCGLKHYESARG